MKTNDVANRHFLLERNMEQLITPISLAGSFVQCSPTLGLLLQKPGRGSSSLEASSSP